MELGEQLNRQRVKHIVTSYQLENGEPEAFNNYLEDLLRVYPSPLVELAIVEVLVDSWLKVPMIRGHGFLAQTHELLKGWENQAIEQINAAEATIASTIGPEQFQQITGLDPSPIFGPSGLPSSQPPISPLGSGL